MNGKRIAVTKAHCNSCAHNTDHDVLHEETRDWGQEVGEGNSIHGSDIYRLITCRGCQSVSMARESTFSEDWNPVTGEPNVTTAYYPARTYRPLPSWIPLSPIPDFVESLLVEIYKAVQNGMPRVAMMGIRALLEAIMIEKVQDQGSFGKNLQAFETGGFISAAQRKVLDAALDAGHAAIHRRYVPKDAELITCMDVAEHVVQAVYVLPATAKRLSAAIPKRKKPRSSPVKKSP